MKAVSDLFVSLVQPRVSIKQEIGRSEDMALFLTMYYKGLCLVDNSMQLFRLCRATQAAPLNWAICVIQDEHKDELLCLCP